MAEFTLRIDGMHCGSCVRRVTQALNSAGNVEVEEVRIGAARLKVARRKSSGGCRHSCSCKGRVQRTIGAINRKMASSATESLTLPVIGMTCASCQHHVESALQETSGVKSAHVDLMANRANIVFDPAEASAARLVEAIRGAGYDAVLPHQGGVPPKEPEDRYGKAEIKAAVTHHRRRDCHVAGNASRHADGRNGSSRDASSSLAVRSAAGLSALVSSGWDRNPDGMGRTRHLRGCCPRPAARKHQHEHPGKPWDRSGVCLFGLRHDLRPLRIARLTLTRFC